MLWSKDKCKHVISYDGTNISLSGIEGPDEIKFKIASFQIKKEVLQPAIDIAQMYDLFQYSNCQKIQQFPKDSPERTQFILEAHKNEERLLEFLSMLRVALARPSEQLEKALANWIAFTFTKNLREEAPIIPEKVRAGELVRESPPLEEYNNLKRNIAKAKISSPYLKEALENPHFDINEVYNIHR
jgi:hypothetical protein